jgi:glycosyltransferase involved in cell wall biosynthesis
MLYLLSYAHAANTATADRLRKYRAGFRRLGVEHEVIYFKYTRPGTWFRLSWRLLSGYRRGDVLFVVGGVDLLFPAACLALGRRVYHEITEHPRVYVLLGFRLLSRVCRFFYYLAVKRLDGLFVISTALARFFEEERGVPREKIRVIPVMCDPGEFPPSMVERAGRQGIVYVGSMSDYKDGVDKLRQACGLLETTEPLVLVHGRLHEEVVEVLCRARLAVLCRPGNLQARYGFATKLGQYLASATPVVVTAVGDVPLFLEDGVSALIARPDDVEDFAGKMQWALDHYDEALEIGRRGREVALEHFDYARLVGEVAEVIFGGK